MGHDQDEIKAILWHMLGLDWIEPYYHRGGKDYYMYCRNYYSAGVNGNPVLDAFPPGMVHKCTTDIGVIYSLTQAGVKWAAKLLDVGLK
nr:MAG TPA: hypothetical protein [Caudoviricetes sp.]